jgi:carbonic anhydrase
MQKQEAVARIVHGVAKFQSEVYPSRREMFERLRHKQEPLALFVTCADARVVPNLFTQTDPGEIFIERNPGNMVPPYVEFVGGVTAGVEYAMLALKVPLIVVCGHTDCGVMKALLDPMKAEGMPGVQKWMSHGVPARDRALREHAYERSEEQLRRVTEYNVLEQIENLKSHPSVRKRLRYDEVEIRGWLYGIGDGSIREANLKTGEFELLSGKT